MHVPRGRSKSSLPTSALARREAQITGGLARIGFAQNLVGPHRAVMAHRWAVDGGTALAFGTLLAAGLATSGPFTAFHEGVEALRAPEGLPERLRAVLGDVDL